MAKHTRDELKQMQALPLNIKIKMTQQRIRDWYNYWGGDVYQSFSGGKDSTVMKHIIDGMGYDVPAVFVNTGLEYPEIQQFVRDIKDGKYDCFNDNVEIIRPKMRFDEVIKTYGYPVPTKEISHKIYWYKRGSEWTKKFFYGIAKDEKGKNSKYNISDKWKFLVNSPFGISDNQCCNVMKKQPTHIYSKQTGRMPYIAVMAEESMLRTQKWIQNGCNAFENKKPVSNPMSFWTEQDVLHYIKEYNVPYAGVYGDIVTINPDRQKQYTLCDNGQKLCTTGCNRTGCMFCMYGLHLEKSPNRFEQMKITHPRQYEYCMKPVLEGGLGIKDVIDWMNENGNLNIKY